MTRHLFPYGIRFRHDRRVELFPAAELLVLGRRGRGIRATFHIDSGASVSLLPASDATALGLSLRGGTPVAIGGIAGEPLHGVQHLVRIAFEAGELRIPVVFVDRPDIPRILGRDGVFDRFAIVFDETRRRVAWLDAAEERDSIDALFTGDRDR
jgi:hypothetical protein